MTKIEKNGLIYFTPYWETNWEEYFSRYKACDFITVDEDDDILKIVACASSKEHNKDLTRLFDTDVRYKDNYITKAESIFEMGAISSVF